MGAPDGGQGSRTLGELLYADEKDPASERDWLGLVQSIAARQPLALRALYQRTHRLVFTSSMRITKARESAEQAMLDVFHDVWRRAAGYDAGAETVLGWIMNLARYRAIEWARFEPRQQHVGQGE